MTCTITLKIDYAVAATIAITTILAPTTPSRDNTSMNNIKQQLKNQKDEPRVSRLYHDTELYYAVAATLARTATTWQHQYQYHLWGS